MNFPNRMAVRCWNHTCTAVIVLAALYFGGRIYVAVASGRVTQILHNAEQEPSTPASGVGETTLQLPAIPAAAAQCDGMADMTVRNCRLSPGQDLDTLINAYRQSEMQIRIGYESQINDLENRLDALQDRANACEVKRPKALDAPDGYSTASMAEVR